MKVWGYTGGRGRGKINRTFRLQLVLLCAILESEDISSFISLYEGETMAKTPQQISEKYQRRVQAAGPDYQAGVQNPSRSWSEGYVSSVNRMVQGFQNAVAEGKPQQGVQALGDTGWKNKTLAKANRYTESAQVAAQGYAARAQEILQAAQAAQSAAGAIPNDTFENRIQRATASMRAISDYWKNR